MVLDATHIDRRERDAARELAAECAADVFLVWVNADESVIRSRLAARTPAGDDMSDARWDTYLAQQRSLEPLGDDEPCVVADGGDTATNNIGAIIDRWSRL